MHQLEIHQQSSCSSVYVNEHMYALKFKMNLAIIHNFYTWFLLINYTIIRQSYQHQINGIVDFVMIVRIGDLFELMGSCFAECYEAVGFVGAKGQLCVLDRHGGAGTS